MDVSQASQPLASAAIGPIHMVGCGNMAGAMLAGWLDAGLDPATVTVVRPSGRVPRPGIRTRTALPEDEVPAILLLGVKPQKLDEVAPDLARALAPETVLISILAGVEHATLVERFPAVRTIVRAMPNLPVRIRRGVTALYAPDADADAMQRVELLMAALGTVERFDEEAQLQLVTALGGSSPAWFYRFAQALAAAGAAEGLDPERSRRIVRATLAGAAELAARSPMSGDALVDEVASPGGTTRAGLDILDPVLPDLIARTLGAAVDRAGELAAAARRRG